MTGPAYNEQQRGVLARITDDLAVVSVSRGYLHVTIWEPQIWRLGADGKAQTQGKRNSAHASQVRRQ
jgi:hypothetical protein